LSSGDQAPLVLGDWTDALKCCRPWHDAALYPDCGGY
jgi:hypothetical protein